jgi:hypothetical protein
MEILLPLQSVREKYGAQETDPLSAPESAWY